MSEELKQILIVGITPYFLEKQGFKFEKNIQKVLDAKHSQNFFEDNIIFLQKLKSLQKGLTNLCYHN